MMNAPSRGVTIVFDWANFRNIYICPYSIKPGRLGPAHNNCVSPIPQQGLTWTPLVPTVPYAPSTDIISKTQQKNISSPIVGMIFST